MNSDTFFNVLDIVELANCIINQQCADQQGGFMDPQLGSVLTVANPVNIPVGAEAELAALEKVAELGRQEIMNNEATFREHSGAIEGLENPAVLQEMIDILTPFKAAPKINRPLPSKTPTTGITPMPTLTPVVSDRPVLPEGRSAPQISIPTQPQRTTSVRTRPSPIPRGMQGGGKICPKGTMRAADGTCISEGS